ncbi:MAG: acetoacetate--CoA ligase [Runella slithyformis]|nr:MAG: acetoacetate--CoA ligase [Runella slithyformis]TAE94487.1 MAG: acetoacetate--CoA ligase [Runella slithyformis]TAF28854.1 MAG: acetoacetate--CoA ligase [Runella slithyformis]TAF48971.1 MAG: acetoacetate--CoA ligase [Runella slithyformis]TAF83531.1 MAG: acetoacetate--CoA ligase [Runella slithyformis]
MIQPILNKSLWTPPRLFAENSNLKKYQNWLFVKKGLYFKTYQDLWDWSVTDLEDFWESIWQFCNIKSYTPYGQILVRGTSDFSDTEWFFGAKINYAEHIFRQKTTARPALLYQSEGGLLRELSWKELESQVAAVAAHLRQIGVAPGDHVAAVLPNIPQAVVAFLATNAVGGVWCSCAIDATNANTIGRLAQIAPKVLIMSDGYAHNGTTFDKTTHLKALVAKLPTLKETILVPYLNPNAKLKSITNWQEISQKLAKTIEFTPVPFKHPLWVFYTEMGQALAQSAGGCLLEHLKTLILHQNVKPNERYFWHGSTHELTWQFSIGSLLAGATLVLYDGAANYPNYSVLWDLIERARVGHFGANAAYYAACCEADLSYNNLKFKYLQSVSSVGVPLPSVVFEWVYQVVKKEIWLVCVGADAGMGGFFAGGCPLLPVRVGEMQSRALGCKIAAYNVQGQPVLNENAEMTVAQPMPAMPLYFLNDQHQKQYQSRYFGRFVGVWSNGKTLKISDRESIVTYENTEIMTDRPF